MKKRSLVLFVCVILVFIAGILLYGIFRWYNQVSSIERMSIEQASKIGEKKIVQLLVQIADTSNDGSLKRGDVVLIAPEDKQFSIAEKEGFLIVKARLTQMQQELLILSLKERSGIFANEQEKAGQKNIKPRKFFVDLPKVGIGVSETGGRVISDSIFDDDILIEKK